MTKQTLTIEAVKMTDYVSGRAGKAVVLGTIENAPYRVMKRATLAHSKGLQLVKGLGASTAIDTPYIGVFDSQRRLLAAWRAMDGLPGYTGTHDKHPLLGGRNMFWRKNA